MSPEHYATGGFRLSREWCSRERAFVLLAGLMIVALILRLDFLFANNFVIDADEAIVGLMALHISQGSAWPVFYYGQHYMGSLEPLLAAGVFRIFGPSSVALVAVPLVWSVTLVPLTYLLARTISGRLGALSAALLMAIPPTGLVVWSAKARGGFVEVICLGALALLCTARWLKRENRSFMRTTCIGLLLGLGWWTNNQIIFFMVPIAFVMAAALLEGSPSYVREPLSVRVWQILQHAIVGVLAFLVGGAPFWWYNVSHDFVSLRMFAPAGGSDVSSHVEGLFSVAIPMLLGAKRFWQEQDIVPYATLCAYLLLGMAVLSYLVVRWRAVMGLLIFKVDQSRPVELFSLFVLCSLCTFSLSSYGWLFAAPRYLLPVYVGLFVLVGFLVEHWFGYARWFAVTMLGLFLSLNVMSSYWGGRAIPGEPHVFRGERVQKDDSELLEWLNQNGVRWIRTNYWIGYRIAFETREQVRFLTYQEPQHERIPEYRESSKDIDPQAMPLVLVPAQGLLVKSALEVTGFEYRSAELSGYAVLWAIAPRFPIGSLIPRDRFSVISSNEKMDPGLAVDQDLSSRWGTAEPQHPGQEFRINFDAPTSVGGVEFDLGTWPQDFPRGLQIELVRADGTVDVLLDSKDWEAVRLYNERSPHFRFRFESRELSAVRFIQTGTDPVFDWSLAEVQIYSGDTQTAEQGGERDVESGVGSGIEG